MLGGIRRNGGDQLREESQPLNANDGQQLQQLSASGLINNNEAGGQGSGGAGVNVSAIGGSERKKATVAQMTIQRSLSWLQFSISLTIFIDVIYGWLLCGLTQACLFSGIESPAWLSKSILLFMALTFIVLVLSYKFVSELSKEWIRALKLILFFWGIVLIIFAILSFIMISGGGTLDDRKQIVDLTEIVQEYYASNCSTGTAAQDCINSKYQRNALIIAIFHLVNGILIFIIFAMLINLDIPDNFRPPSTSRRQGNEQSFISLDQRYTNPQLRRKVEKEGEDGLKGGKGENQAQQIGLSNTNLDLERLRHVEGVPNPEPFRNHLKPYA